MKVLLTLLLSFMLVAPAVAARSRSSARKTYSHPSSSSRRSAVRKPSSRPRVAKSSAQCASCPRDTRGRIARSSSAKKAFQKSNPCPSTGKASGPCPGYVVDHVVPLKRGGADNPSNMQWQTKEAAKAKDRVED